MIGLCLEGAHRGLGKYWKANGVREPCWRTVNAVFLLVVEIEKLGREGFLVEEAPKLRSERK